jgi:hypothetical protein
VRGRLSEIAIITIGARWQAEFEWWAHAPMAREHGVADAVVDAIGRGRLTGRRVLVVGAGTQPSPEPDPPLGNGRAISVLAAREGAAVACADCDAGAAEATAALVRAEHTEGPGNGGQATAVVLADVAAPDACAAVVADSAAALGGLDGVALNVGPHRAPPAVRPSGDGLGGGLRHGVAAVRRIELRQRAPAGSRRRRDRLRMTLSDPVGLTVT